MGGKKERSPLLHQRFISRMGKEERRVEAIAVSAAVVLFPLNWEKQERERKRKKEEEGGNFLGVLCARDETPSFEEGVL